MKDLLIPLAFLVGGLCGIYLSQDIADNILFQLGAPTFGQMQQQKQDCESTIPRNHHCEAVVYFEETQEVKK